MAISLYFLSNTTVSAQNDSIRLDAAYLINETNRLLSICLKPQPLPLISLYLKGGINLSKKKYVVANYINGQLEGTTSKYGRGLLTGIGLEYYLKKNFALNAELSYSYKTLNSHRSQFNNWMEISLNERQKWIEFPIVIKYVICNSKIKPYLLAGASFEKQINNKPKLIFSINDENGKSVQEVLLSENTYRNGNNLSLILGGGVKLYHHQDYFFLDLRYSLGLNHYDYLRNSPTYEDYGYHYNFYTNGYFLRNLYFSFGYAKTILRKK